MSNNKIPLKTVVVKLTNQFGNVVIQPVCVNAQTFADIAGTKTLTRQTVDLIKRLGYYVDVKQETLTMEDVK